MCACFVQESLLLQLVSATLSRQCGYLQVFLISSSSITGAQSPYVVDTCYMVTSLLSSWVQCEDVRPLRGPLLPLLSGKVSLLHAGLLLFRKFSPLRLPLVRYEPEGSWAGVVYACLDTHVSQHSPQVPAALAALLSSSRRLIPKDLDDRMFLVVWGVMNGPIAWAVVAFGNSLVTALPGTIPSWYQQALDVIPSCLLPLFCSLPVHGKCAHVLWSWQVCACTVALAGVPQPGQDHLAVPASHPCDRHLQHPVEAAGTAHAWIKGHHTRMHQGTRTCIKGLP